MLTYGWIINGKEIDLWNHLLNKPKQTHKEYATAYLNKLNSKNYEMYKKFKQYEYENASSESPKMISLTDYVIKNFNWIKIGTMEPLFKTITITPTTNVLIIRIVEDYKKLGYSIDYIS